MLQPGRQYAATSGYRYGFNGKENDNEVKGEGNQQDYGMRIYDPRLGRFLSVDPITKQYPELTPYQFASNRPIDGIDLDGFEYFDSKKFMKPSSLYGLNKFEIFSSNYTIGHLRVIDQEIHKIIINHPRSTLRSDEIEDPDEPEIEMVKKRNSSNRAQARQTLETSQANVKMSADIATGIVDLVKWGINTYYDIKYKKEIQYAGASIGALNNADILVRAANDKLPTLLKGNETVLRDLTNYTSDGTIPTDNLAYSILIKSWGDLIFKNKEKVLKGSFDFTPEKTIYEKRTITTNGGEVQKTYYTSRVVGNNDPDVFKANELLKNPCIPPPAIVKPSN